MGPLVRALKQLATATKTISFYPAQHPTVSTALDKASVFLKEALTDLETLTVGVADAAFLVDRTVLEEGDRVLGGFASYLSRRNVSGLSFRSPVEPEALKGFLEVIALDPGTLRSRGGPMKSLEERRLGGISVVEFDAAEALRSARTGTGAEAGAEKTPSVSWSDLLARFLAGQSSVPPGGEHLIRRVAGDARAAWELMASLQKICAEAGPNRSGILTGALKRIAAEVGTAEPEALSSLAQNLAAALMALDPQGRKEILGTSIPVAGTDVDLAGAIRASIPEDNLGELIVSMVQSEGRVNARLGSVIRKVLIDRGVNDQQKTSVLEAIRSARGVDKPPADVWDSVEDLLKESQDDWISREYKGLLEMIGASAPPLEEGLKRELLALPEVVEAMTPEGIRRRAWLLFGDLVGVDHEPARRWVALDQIEKRASGLTPDWFAECSGVAEAVLAILAAGTSSPPHVREAAQKAIRATADALVRCYRKSFHTLKPEHHTALAAAFQAMGEHCVESLLLGLAEEEDWEIRKPFIGFLASRQKGAVPALVRRLTDPSWYLVRNILLILGEIADPATIPAIAPCLKHAEPRVRRDAVAALGKIGGPRAFALLRECLDDPEVHEVALRSLAAIDRRRTIGAFLEMTERVDLFGRGNQRLKEAISTLGALGGNESVPRLRAILMRGMWLPPWAGDTVRVAAARALEKIGTTTALNAIQEGSRLWRGPVAGTCAEIIGQRSMGGLTSRN
ncbi:MAG TPA: HEAT repeat domain-containing protein [Candidatus Polarisedimenticolia bacterium]|nr:HEAT repeat domain-containing protein [Candidatus Polarisedimenticolia bacterium]